MRSVLSLSVFGLLSLQAVAHPVADGDVAVAAAAAMTRTPIDSSTYDNLAYFASYPPAANQLATGGCQNPPHGSVIIDYFSMTLTDTQAAIFRDDSQKAFVLGVPGSASVVDAITDFDTVPVPYVDPNHECIGCLAHLGFYTAWNSIKDDVTTQLKTQFAAYPSYDLIISGHSLGGAIATLAFATLKPQFSNLRQSYTYGAPRVGNQGFANFIDSLSGATESNVGIFNRVTHYNDGAPQQPPSILGFVHSRTEFFESAQVPSESTSFRCYGQEPADCNDAVGDKDLLTGINDAHNTYAGLQYSCNSTST